MAECNQKIRQLSTKQKETLVNFVYARPEMQKGKLTPTYTKVVANALWEHITANLNSIPEGSIKTPVQWNRTWRDLRKNVKNKVSKEIKYSKGTGDGPPMPPPESAVPESTKSIDEKITEILTPVAVEGNIEVPDPFFIAEDIIVETANDLDENKGMNSFNMEHDYPSTSGIENEGKQMQPDVLPTEPESRFYKETRKTQNTKQNSTSKNLQD